MPRALENVEHRSGMNQSLFRLFILLLIFRGHAPTHAAKLTQALDVWPGTAPGEKGDIKKEGLLPARPGSKVDRLANVSRPTISLYSAPKNNNTGAAVVVCPGGGYSILAMDLEGTEVCEWLNSIGVNAVLLKYRVRVARIGQNMKLHFRICSVHSGLSGKIRRTGALIQNESAFSVSRPVGT